MVYIYILKLRNNKYYIGKTQNPTFRLEDHFENNGSTWTKINKPILVHEIKPDCDNEDEDKITIQYMKKYGINNVRGGSFCKNKLDEASVSTIKRMISGSSDKCYNCGEDHFVKDCPDMGKQKCQLAVGSAEWGSWSKNKCDRCGRSNHTSDNCYASTHINGKYIDDSDSDSDSDIWECQFCGKEFDSEKGARFHENMHCKKRKLSKTNRFDPVHCLWDELKGFENPSGKCYRCGRKGHYADNCYAEIHVNGYLLN